MFSVLNDDFISHFYHALWSWYFSFHLVAEFIIYFVLHIYGSRFKWSFPICFLKKQFKGLTEKLYTEQYPHHLNQALRNEAESDRARLLWAETPPPPNL